MKCNFTSQTLKRTGEGESSYPGATLGVMRDRWALVEHWWETLLWWWW